MAVQIDITRLEERYDFIRLSVLSSHAISNRTAAVVSHLSPASEEKDKLAICSLHAKAHVANKLISIVEIAKRELTGKGIKVYQYSSLGSEISHLKEPVQSSGPPNKDAIDDAVDDGEEDAFQTLEKKDKVRAVPVLTVYLAETSVRELKDVFREQLTPETGTKV